MNQFIKSTTTITTIPEYIFPYTQSDIITIRSWFEDELLVNPTLYHPLDINRVRTEDWAVVRFLERSPNRAEAWRRIKDSLQWKVKMGVHTKTEEQFPREFYEINNIEIMGHNKEDRLIIWATSKYSRDFSELKVYIKEFIRHEIEMFDQMASESGKLMIIIMTIHSIRQSI